ncbi:MAG TPA: HAD-IA family hydrolase [Candidatus Andersenbacteria bacterium]|nr:HAD-IA family hydrolase [Candidatus Andersenbacteria bacterium]
MNKILLLDVDDVIITGEHFSYCLERDYGLTREDTSAFYKYDFMECLLGKADIKKKLAPFLVEWGYKKGIDTFLEYWFTSHNKIDDRIIAIVKSLNALGIHSYLATNQEKYRSEYLWETLGFKHIFTGMFSSSAIGCVKAEPEFFRYIIKTLTTEPSNLLFFDDDQKNIDSANSVGIDACLYTDFEGFDSKIKLWTK